MDESENQRVHLMSFVAMEKPGTLERLLIVIGQGIFYNAYFLLYLVSPRTAHRVAGYLAERSVAGYSDLLQRIRAGEQPDSPAPASAIAYWDLAPDAGLSDMIVAIREDEAIHRDIHHAFADALTAGNAIPDRPGPAI
jgi:ubiquinol oxidase